jgi:CheY-like chemotaxis protein
MADKQRILIVDDEPQIGRVMRTGLSTRGFDVRVAADGEAGLDLLKLKDQARRSVTFKAGLDQRLNLWSIQALADSFDSVVRPARKHERQ